MASVNVAREKQRLDHVFDLVQHLEFEDEILAHWARYLCILVSGYIESALRTLLLEYAAKNSHPYVNNYVANQIKGITNLNEEKISQLLGSFCADWRQTLDDVLTDEQKDAIDSVVANRNNIVHGRSVGITLPRIRNYYGRVAAVIRVIENDCIS